MNDYLVAVDLGTSGTRVLAFAKDGTIAAKAYSEFPSSFPHAGWVEQDANLLWETTAGALRDVLSRVGAERVAAIGITNQRETTIVWDRDTGTPRAPAIVWQDRRTEALCQSLSDADAFVRDRTGLLIDPYFSGSKLRWLVEQDASLARDMAEGRVCFGTPDVWLLWKLTGGKTFATEPSNACRTLLFDLRRGIFDDDLLSLFQAPRACLPEIRASDAHFGDTDPAITGRSIPVHGILGDQQASLLAQGAWGPGIVKNTYGTGLFLLTNTGESVRRSPTLLSTVAWRRGERTQFALEGSVLMGGAVLQWLRDHLKLIEGYDQVEAMARSVSGNDGVYFVPALQGLGAPYWDAGARGTITGLTRKATRETIVRAALEAMAYQTKDVVDEMSAALGRPIERLRVDGGMSNNDFLMQFQADMLGIPVERPQDVETTALGAAAIAGLGSGFWSEEDLSRCAAPAKTFAPSFSAEQRDALYRGWTDAVVQARSR